MTATFTTQIDVDASNVAWIGGTRVKVIEVVLDKIAYGWSPEEIHFQHPGLSLAQIHGALTYYYEHQEALDAEIAKRAGDSAELAQHAADADFRARIASIKNAK